VPTGTHYIPMAQPAATMAAMALEARFPGSLVGVGLIPLPSEGSEPPIYRVTAPFSSAACVSACGRPKPPFALNRARARPNGA
jgi:hypothetical protein